LPSRSSAIRTSIAPLRVVAPSHSKIVAAGNGDRGTGNGHRPDRGEREAEAVYALRNRLIPTATIAPARAATMSRSVAWWNGSKKARSSRLAMPPPMAHAAISTATRQRRLGHRCPSVRCPRQWGQVAIYPRPGRSAVREASRTTPRTTTPAAKICASVSGPSTRTFTRRNSSANRNAPTPMK